MYSISYPAVRRCTQVDVYHGVEVPDPYRWLEDALYKDTKEFVDSQNQITKAYLNKFVHRDAIHSRLSEMWDFIKTSVLYKHGEYYYFFKNTGLQNQSILYRQRGLYDEPEVFFDPNDLSSDGTISLHGHKFSEDGKIFAYKLSENDSDWVKIYFKKVNTGENYPEVLENVKFSSIAWTHDSRGVFYARYPSNAHLDTSSEQFSHQKLYYHIIGKSQKHDILCAEFLDEPDMRIGAEISDCGKWLILNLVKGCKNNMVYVADLSDPRVITKGKLQLIPIIDKFEADYEYITNNGNIGMFRTNQDSPNYRIVNINFNKPQKSEWKNVIPEHSVNILDWATPIDNDKLMVCFIKNVSHCLYMYSMDGTFMVDFVLDLGTVTGFSGKRNDTECFFRFTSFLTPGRIYRVDFKNNDYIATMYRETIIDEFDASKYEVQQLFYDGEDGTKIPMYIIQKAGFNQDPNHACLLYGYGGFNVSLLPSFSVARLLFIQNFQGIIAIANIRGGGEYGERWHNAGRLFNKQNSFSDFQKAMEYLIKEKYTSPKKLVIQGGSNGGLLVSTCVNQARHLIGAAIAQVPVTDMLRFHKHTIGYAWTSDYGSSDDKEQFNYLLTYSPLHNVKHIPDTPYPATLVLTADHDDRVVPSHSYKFVATLQNAENCRKDKNPIFLYVDTKTGHGSGKPTYKQISEWTDIFCFIALSLRLMYNPH